MSASFPIALLNATHYHQSAQRQPASRAIERDRRCVELVTAGRGWVQHRGQWQPVTAGALLWHRTGDRTIGRSDPADPYRCLSVHFQPGPGFASAEPPRLTWWTDLQEVRSFTRDIVQRFVDEQFDRAALSAYAIGRLLYQAHLHLRHEHGPDWPRGLSRVLEAIEQHYDETLQLVDLAQLAGWSVAHLHEVFKQHLGTSPHQALIQRRLRAAREQLVSSNRPIKQIAGACGFSSSAAFCRRFRLASGMTPASYRQRHALGSSR